jgi:hypothetical protein
MLADNGGWQATALADNSGWVGELVLPLPRSV